MTEVIVKDPAEIFQRQEFLVDNLSAFRTWKRTLFRPGRRYRFRQYRFAFSGISADENQQLSDRVNDYYGACGCRSGSYFMMLTLAILIAGYFFRGGSWSSIGLGNIALCLGACLAASVVGKGLGLLYARVMLIRISKVIESRLMTP